jgi:hypothetical protein
MEIKKVGVAGRGLLPTGRCIHVCAQSGYRTSARDHAGLTGSWSDAARRDSAPEREQRQAHRSRSAVARNNLHGIAVANLADSDLSHTYVLQEPRTKNLEPGTETSPAPVATEVEADRGSGQGEACKAGAEGLKSRIYL